MLAISAGPVHGSVSATLTPNTTDSLSTTPVVLQILGLSTGQSVTIERYADNNGNGVIDSGDTLAEIFTVTEGQVTSIGGIRNTNVPGDEDLATNGQITVYLTPSLGAEMGRLAGQQIIRVSSPTSAFTSFTQTLAISQSSYGQSVSGNVTDGINPLPYAGVFLLSSSSNGKFVMGVHANASGQYALSAPIGSYRIVAARSGYLSNFGSPSTVSLTSGGSPTQNITLTPATTSVSGKVADASTGTGLGGVQLLLSNSSGLSGITTTNADGTYSIPVTASQWNFEVSSISLARLGYVAFQNQSSAPTPNTTVGAASGVNISLPKVTSLVYGTVTNSASVPQPGITVGASDGTSTYDSGTSTDSNGNYVLGATTGSWYVSIPNDSPGLSGYIVPTGQSLSLTTGQAAQQNFTLTSVTSNLQGVVTNNGIPASGIQIGASNQTTYQWIQTTTAADGSFNLGVLPGTWSVQLETTSADSNNLVGPSLVYTISNGQTISSISYQVVNGTSLINGVVNNSSSNPITNAFVNAYAIIGGTTYTAGSQTDSSGNYSFPVINGTWHVGVSANGYSSPNQISLTISGSGQTHNFTLGNAPVITSQPTPQSVQTGQTANFTVAASGSSPLTYQWQVSSNGGTTWTTLGNDSTYNVSTPGTLSITTNTGLNGDNYQCIISNGYGQATSNMVLLGVFSGNTAPTFTGQPTNQTVNAGQTAIFTVSASGLPSPTIQWYVNTGNGWTALSNGMAYSGVTSPTLTITGTTTDMTGNRYRAVATNTVSPSATSNNALLIVNNVGPSFTGEPTSQTVTVGQGASFTVAIGGVPTPSIQWQVSTDGGFTFSNLSNNSTYSGVTTNTLSISGTTLSENGWRYQAVATNTVGSSTSSQALLTVNPLNSVPVFTGQPSDQVVVNGQYDGISVSVSGFPTPTLQWQVSTNGGTTWSNISNNSTYSGVTTNRIRILASMTLNAYRYQCVASNSAGSTPSNSVLFSVVNISNTAPTITSGPTNQTVSAGQSASFTVAAGGTPTPSIQWQVSTDTGFTWNNISNNATYSGATSTTLSVTGTTTGMSGYRYQAVATNVVSSAVSNEVLLTVNVGTTFSSWQQSKFNSTQLGIPAISGPLATPANDGLSNLFKYAFNLNPFTSSTYSQVFSKPTVSGSNLIFTCQAIRTDVNYTFETSNDLSHWSSITTVTNGTQLTATYSMIGHPMAYFRMKVTMP